MSHQITLRFEDGVTQQIDCRAGESVANAALRAKIAIPLDCRDGVCGTCKATCHSGNYELGDYVDDALSPQEAGAGRVLTCQMHPSSDCVVDIAAASNGASVRDYHGHLTESRALSPTTLTFSIALDEREALNFEPGQYVNVQIPGTEETRSYSFSSGPSAREVCFVVRNVPQGLMSGYLSQRAKAGDAIRVRGPMGGFYLRSLERPALFLAGGTGLAPFLSMLDKLAETGDTAYPIQLIFGVTRDEDLVALAELDDYARRLPNFRYLCTVADPQSTHPHKGYVTQHFDAAQLNGGDVDVYLCGPPPMVDAVRDYLSAQGLTPRNFYYEKFAGSSVALTSPQPQPAKPSPAPLAWVDVDDAFDLRLALELGAVQLTMGRLSGEQLTTFRRLAEATAAFVSGRRFLDVTRYAEANHAFHMFLIEATKNAQLIALYRKLAVQEYIHRALNASVEIVGDIVQQHRDLVAAFEYGCLNTARDVLAQHTQHSRTTMSRALAQDSPSAAATPDACASVADEEPDISRCPFHAMMPPALPPYSHELSWPPELEPFKVVDDGSQGDPYEHYRWMREHAPVLRCQSATTDVWFLSRYDDVYQAIRNPKLFSSEVVSPPPLTFLTLFDAPGHTRLRKVAQPSFMPLSLEPFIPQIERRADALLERMLENDGGDVVEDFAIPLSIATISTLIDVPNEDEEKMKFWSDETFSYFGRLARNAPGTGTDEQSAMAFFAYLKEAMERLYISNSQSIGGHIARMWKQGLLSEKEAKELCAFVFIAGHDTTTILVANAFRMFAEQPTLVSRLQRNIDDADNFVEEVARYRGTVQRVSRITTEETTVAGVTIPKGAMVRLLLSAANRDSRKFANGETFDIDRDTSGHLGFGNGMHKCLGQPLAKLETLIAAKLVAQKVGEISLDPTRPIQYVRGNNLTNSGPQHLYVRMTRRTD